MNLNENVVKSTIKYLLFNYQIILLLVKYCLDIVYDTFFLWKCILLLSISALLSACLQKISEADSASKWVEIVSEVQRIEFVYEKFELLKFFHVGIHTKLFWSTNLKPTFLMVGSSPIFHRVGNKPLYSNPKYWVKIDKGIKKSEENTVA